MNNESDTNIQQVFSYSDVASTKMSVKLFLPNALSIIKKIDAKFLRVGN